MSSKLFSASSFGYSAYDMKKEYAIMFAIIAAVA